MKILYAVQATGNGHIARAKEILPYLRRYGSVDVFLSGSNSTINVDLPVVYRSNGISLFYGNSGGLDYWKMMRAFAPLRLWREIDQLPVEKYDLVINDFEAVSSLACHKKKIPFVHFGHQASFVSANTPRPQKTDGIGEWLLHHYARSSNNIGLHFAAYDDFICSPIIKQQVLEGEPTNQGHITVYLSHYSDAVVESALSQISDTCFHIFSKQVKQKERRGNLVFIPVNNQDFTESMLHSDGVITGAGFETPAEALYLGKKLLCLPIRGQYEQLCNAASLLDFDVPIVNAINNGFPATVQQWLATPAPAPLELLQSTGSIVERAVAKGLYATYDQQVYDTWLAMNF
jgi:uncharacterized protein (TIGR00661 family)